MSHGTQRELQAAAIARQRTHHRGHYARPLNDKPSDSEAGQRHLEWARKLCDRAK